MIEAAPSLYSEGSGHMLQGILVSSVGDLREVARPFQAHALPRLHLAVAFIEVQTFEEKPT